MFICFNLFAEFCRYCNYILEASRLASLKQLDISFELSFDREVMLFTSTCILGHMYKIVNYKMHANWMGWEI